MPRFALIPTVETERLAPEALRGKQVFYNAADPRMARHKYLSCAVCHLDGGTDGRVWDFTHKGEGLRRTTSLLGKAGLGQGPLHWSANFDEVQDFEHDMRDAFQGTGFLDEAAFNQGSRNRPLGDKKAGLSPGLDDLAAYVASLARARPSPFRRADGSMTDEAKEGERIFNRSDVGCAVCHAPPLFTDSRLPPDTSGGYASGSFRTAEGFLLHDVGTLHAGSGRRLGDTLRGLDTPTLKGLWELEAFLHDGSAPTLMDVITTANPDDRHGKTSGLSATERRQLVAFLMQLGDSAGTTAIRGTQPRQAAGRRISLGAARTGTGVVFTLVDADPAGTGGMPPSLEILGLSGQVHRKLAFRQRGAAGAGTWTAQWDGRGEGNRASPPGLYLARARRASRIAITALTWIP